MRRAQSINVSAPSSSLLRFLRSQSEEVCYFTPNHSPNLFQKPRSRLLRNAPYQSHLDHFPPATRKFSTSHRRRATVEPPLSSIDFPRIARRQEVLYQYPPVTASRTGIVRPNASQDNTATRRYASTDSRPLLKRLWQLKRQKPDSALKPNDLPPLPSFLDDAAGTTLGRSKGKGANELKLRCTEINEKGEVTLVNGEFKKSELIAKVHLKVDFVSVKVLTSLIVWPPSSRPAKNRFLPTTSHPRPTLGYLDQPPAPARLNQA